MFVIDEETGGNGSLDLALDRRAQGALRFDACTGVHRQPAPPANRGAVFIRARAVQDSRRRMAGASPSDGPRSSHASFALRSLRLRHPRTCWMKARPSGGKAITRSSRTAPSRPAPESSAPFGVHPSAICGEVSFESGGTRLPDEATLRDWIESAIRRYVARHGDKTQVVDPATGETKVERHYDLDWQGDGRCSVMVHGAAGHMGSLPQNDAAIAKWAFVVRELVEPGARRLPSPRPAGRARGRLLPTLVFEGAQGFLPTHPMEEVKTRVRHAFLTGLEAVSLRRGLSSGDHRLRRDLRQAAQRSLSPAIPTRPHRGEPLRTAVEIGLVPACITHSRGWEVSCDARLFAGEYPGLPVITFGAGSLEHAHSDLERIRVADLIESYLFVSLFVLRETGTIT